MRKAGLALMILTLAACGQIAEPPVAPDATTETAEAPASVLGSYVAISTTAMSITGDLDLSSNVLSFAKGFRIEEIGRAHV